MSKHDYSVTWAAVAAIAIGVWVSTGCQTVTEGPGAAFRVSDARAPQARIGMNTVGFLDQSLQNPRKGGKIAVEKINARRTPTGTLEVWASLRNRTDHPLQIEARTHFFDSTEYPIEPPSGWTRLSLHPNAVEAYRAHSVNIDDVAFYYVEIREGL